VIPENSSTTAIAFYVYVRTRMLFFRQRMYSTRILFRKVSNGRSLVPRSGENTGAGPFNLYLSLSPAHVVQWSNHLGAMCSRAWRSQWPRIDSSLGPGASAYEKRIISNNSYAHDNQGDNPGRENRGLDGVLYKLWPFVSDIAIFMLKRDAKLQLTNLSLKFYLISILSLFLTG